ncbi:hypothetical protein RB595_006369 [Gaeumannomyces hyphopodioides]
MPSLTRVPSSTKSTKSSTKSSKSSKSTSTRDSHGTRSTESYESTSSNATTIANSVHGSHVRAAKPSGPTTKPVVHQQQPHRKPQHITAEYQEDWCDSDSYEDLSPGTCVHARDSVDTYASTSPSQANLVDEEDDDVDSQRSNGHDEIPPLPLYRHEVVEPNVRPTTPNEFAKLFPSLNRLSIRHDEFTSDGNMNLRVDTPVRSSRRRGAAQLFHLRMYDLARREFSLRRYCRDSGREVCNSKRRFASPAAPASSKKDGREAAASDSSCSSYSSAATPAEKRQEATRPSLPRAVSSAFKSFSSRPQSKRVRSSPAAATVAGIKRPGSSGSSSSSDHEPPFWGAAAKKTATPATPALPTNIIKLEFSNYARVEIERRGKSSSDSKRYDFEWWGHKYSWRRTTDKHTGAVSFHLVRDGGAAAKKGDSTVVAHIVPETRSPIQVADDEEAGGWVPPCHMWINDESVLDAMTDVADVIVATGLIALVDDCIKERWQMPKMHRIPLTSRTVNLDSVGPKAFIRQVFGRRNSAGSTSPSKPAPHGEKYGKHDEGYGYAAYEHEYQRHRHAVPAY